MALGHIYKNKNQDGAEHGSRVASSYQTLQFFLCFVYMCT